MRYPIPSWCGLAILICFSCGSTETAKSGLSESTWIPIDTSGIDSRVRLIEVFAVNKLATSRIRRTPDLLNSAWTEKTIYRWPSAEQVAVISRAVRGIGTTEGSSGADICRGITAAREINGMDQAIALYFDCTGREGSIDGRPVRFNADAFSTIKAVLNTLTSP